MNEGSSLQAIPSKTEDRISSFMNPFAHRPLTSGSRSENNSKGTELPSQ